MAQIYFRINLVDIRASDQGAIRELLTLGIRQCRNFPSKMNIFQVMAKKHHFFKFLGGQIPILSKLTPYFDFARRWEM